jgi:hypothetical protein
MKSQSQRQRQRKYTKSKILKTSKSKTIKKIKMNKKQVNKRKYKHLKYQEDKRKMNGGTGEINIINLNDSTNIHSILNSTLYPEIENYKNGLIYFSIGSKFNEKTLEIIDGTDNNRKKTIRTNSIYQMIPSFLCDNSIQRMDPSLSCYEDNTMCNCLCIILDSFSQERRGEKKSELDENIYIIQNYLYVNNVSNIKIYILNYYAIRNENNLLLTEQIIRGFCDELISKNVDPARFMLCNYVKFKEEQEEIREIAMTNMLTRILTEKNYEDSHYEWFGYNKSGYLLYNFIYLNNKFNKSNLIIFLMMMPNLVKNAINNAIKQREMYENDPSFKIHMLKKGDFRRPVNDIKELKYVYQLTPIITLDNDELNNLFTYNLYNTITS